MARQASIFNQLVAVSIVDNFSTWSIVIKPSGSHAGKLCVGSEVLMAGR